MILMTVVLISFIPGSAYIMGEGQANCGIDSFRGEYRRQNGRNTSMTFTGSSPQEDMLKWVNLHVLRLSQKITVSHMMPRRRRYVPNKPLSQNPASISATNHSSVVF